MNLKMFRYTGSAVGSNIRSNVLPPSLGIRLNNISDANKIIDKMETEKTANKDIMAVQYSQQTIDMFKISFIGYELEGNYYSNIG